MSAAKEITFYINEAGCYICASHLPNTDGYPNVTIKKKHWRIARLIYTRNYGEIPAGKLVRHTCDERLCINPKHLLLGTIQDNVRDRVNRGRNGNQKGELNNQCKLTEFKVKEIFELKYKSGFSIKKIAVLMGVSTTIISFILSRKRWVHVDVSDLIKQEHDL